MRIDAHHSFTGRYTLEYLESILKRNRFEGSIVVVDNLDPDWPTPDFVRAILVNIEVPVDPECYRAATARERCVSALETLQRHPKFRGLVGQALPPALLAELQSHNLTLDLIAPPSVAIQIADQYPNLRLALVHAGQPPGGTQHPDDWARDLALAAQIPHLVCKLSSVARLQPTPRMCVQHALAVFGPSRLMFGSDWPAGLPEISWKASLAAFTQAIGAQTIETREQLLGGTAERFYEV